VIKEGATSLELDGNCRFSCENSIRTSKNLLENELNALSRIRDEFERYANQRIWRYATHVGEKPFMKLLLPRGWYLQKE
jgi:hypothetical protein